MVDFILVSTHLCISILISGTQPPNGIEYEKFQLLGLVLQVDRRDAVGVRILPMVP